MISFSIIIFYCSDSSVCNKIVERRQREMIESYLYGNSNSLNRHKNDENGKKKK